MLQADCNYCKSSLRLPAVPVPPPLDDSSTHKPHQLFIGVSFLRYIAQPPKSAHTHTHTHMLSTHMYGCLEGKFIIYILKSGWMIKQMCQRSSHRAITRHFTALFRALLPLLSR